MLGSLGQYSRQYLLILMLVTTAFFALPIFLSPLQWARRMKRRIPGQEEQVELAVYFGRCLGAFVLVLELMLLRAALTGVGIKFLFEIMFGAFALMWLVHVYGAVRRIQPMAETLEIGFWTVLLVLNTLFYPVASG